MLADGAIRGFRRLHPSVVLRSSHRTRSRLFCLSSFPSSPLLSSAASQAQLVSSHSSPRSEITPSKPSSWQRLTSLVSTGFLAVLAPSVGKCEAVKVQLGQATDVAASAPVLDPGVAAAGLDAATAAETPTAAQLILELANEHYFAVKGAILVTNDLHYAGLPWFASIMALTLAMRLGLLPFVIISTKGGARLAKLRPQMAVWTAELERQKAMGNTAAQVDHNARLLQLFKDNGVSPFTPMLAPMTSIPIFITLFLSFQAICAKAPGIKTGGALWFQDLSIADPYYALPIISSLITFTIVRRNSEQAGAPIDPKYKPMFTIMSGFALLSPLVTHMLPAGINMYFCTMGLMSFVQGELLKTDGVRRMIGVPTLREVIASANSPPPNMESNPYIETVAKEKQAKEVQKQTARQNLQFFKTPEAKASPKPDAKPAPPLTKADENRKKWQSLMVPRKKQASGSKKKGEADPEES